MVVFPGTIERLLDQAEDAIQAEEFDEAVHFCEQLLELGQNPPEVAGILSIALYEIKEFERAKPYATEWLQSGNNDYFEAMELYLAICMQLQEYVEVEDILGALLDEGVIPPDLKQKFVYLRELNGRLSKRFTEELLPTSHHDVSFDDFLKMDPYVQQQLLANLEKNGAERARELLSQIATYDSLAPVLRTVALVLLKKIGFEQPLVIRKFGRGKTVVPSHLPLPGEDPITLEVCAYLEQSLDKDPTRYALMEEAVKKFSVISYPLDWGAPPEAVAVAYENYSSYLFEGSTLPKTALHQLIIEVDQDSSATAE